MLESESRNRKETESIKETPYHKTYCSEQEHISSNNNNNRNMRKTASQAPLVSSAVSILPSDYAITRKRKGSGTRKDKSAVVVIISSSD